VVGGVKSSSVDGWPRPVLSAVIVLYHKDPVLGPLITTCHTHTVTHPPSQTRSYLYPAPLPTPDATPLTSATLLRIRCVNIPGTALVRYDSCTSSEPTPSTPATPPPWLGPAPSPASSRALRAAAAALAASCVTGQQSSSRDQVLCQVASQSLLGDFISTTACGMH
jgi:hypothetical protein